MDGALFDKMVKVHTSKVTFQVQVKKANVLEMFRAQMVAPGGAAPKAPGALKTGAAPVTAAAVAQPTAQEAPKAVATQ